MIQRRVSSATFLSVILLIWADAVFGNAKSCSVMNTSTANTNSSVTKNQSADVSQDKKNCRMRCDVQAKAMREEKHYICRNLQSSLVEYARSTKKMIRNMMEDQQSSLDYLSNQVNELMSRVMQLNGDISRSPMDVFPHRAIQSHGLYIKTVLQFKLKINGDDLVSAERKGKKFFRFLRALRHNPGKCIPRRVFSALADAVDTLNCSFHDYVLCEMDFRGGGWTVIQKRTEGVVGFQKTWSDYLDGFGDLSGEFWLGLRKVFHIVNQKTANFMLYVDLESEDDTYAYASYDSFWLEDEACSFKIHLGRYSGNAGDAFRGLEKEDSQNSFPFSTYDMDNDGCNPECSLQEQPIKSCSNFSDKTGWWFSQCGLANLNGIHRFTGRMLQTGIRWDTWSVADEPVKIKSASMKIRRTYFR